MIPALQKLAEISQRSYRTEQKMAASGISTVLTPHIQSLIDKHREELIKTAVADPTAREKLLEINKAIIDLKQFDPNIVAAWGLGCGGSCIVAAGSIGETITR